MSIGYAPKDDKNQHRIDPRFTFLINDWKFPGGFVECDEHNTENCNDCLQHNLSLEDKHILWQDRKYHWVHFEGEDDPRYLKAKRRLMDWNGYGWWWYVGVKTRALPEEAQKHRKEMEPGYFSRRIRKYG